MKIASIQLGIRDDESKAERTDRALAMAEGCAGADLVMLPEIWNTGYFGFDRYHEEAEPLDGDLVTRAGAVARALGAYLHVGSFVEKTADGRIYRPWRPHEDRELLTPGAVTDYLIDIFPVGHVFLPGHQLVVKVHAPPADDNDYNYIPKTLPGQNTLHFGPDTPTRLMLPIIPMSQVQGFEAPMGQCPYASMRCLPGG